MGVLALETRIMAQSHAQCQDGANQEKAKNIGGKSRATFETAAPWHAYAAQDVR
jgi:hypothetical protein